MSKNSEKLLNAVITGRKEKLVLAVFSRKKGELVFRKANSKGKKLALFYHVKKDVTSIMRFSGARANSILSELHIGIFDEFRDGLDGGLCVGCLSVQGTGKCSKCFWANNVRERRICGLNGSLWIFLGYNMGFISNASYRRIFIASCNEVLGIKEKKNG